MNDPLEDFIRKNRQDFDEKVPSDKVWKKIEASIGFHSKNWWNAVGVWRAAAVIFMMLSAYLLIPKTAMQQPKASDLAASEFKDVEEFYFQQISEKVELIDDFPKNEGLNGFTQDFKQLDAMYMILKEEMKSRPSEKVKDALVLNLLIRINLLNQQLSKLDKGFGKTSQKKDDEV